MMANRKLPFGYCMQNGQIHIVEAEAEVVRMLFTSYAEGNSYETLAEWLNDRAIPYLPGKQWNKNTVARVLQNVRYLGDNGYPPIIGSEMFRRRKPAAGGKLNQPQIKDIRILARCGMCGDTVRRERVDTWRCPHCMRSAARVTDKQLMDSASELLQHLCGHPDVVVNSPTDETENSSALTAKNDLGYTLECAEFNESAAKAKVISLAAARFNALGSEDYETMRIRYILSTTEQSGGLDTVLLRQITSAILIHPQGEVSMKLKNGQIITGSDHT